MFTTNIETPQGLNITQYFGVIMSTKCVGIELDMSMSWLARNGVGSSGLLQNRTIDLYTSVKSNIESEARKIGANAVIGFKVTYTCLPGSGKNVFLMAVGEGTACIIEGAN